MIDLLHAAHAVVNTCPSATPVASTSSQDRLWEIVGVVFIAEFVLPPIASAVKAVFTWVKDLRELRDDLYEAPGEDEEEDDEEEDDE